MPAPTTKPATSKPPLSGFAVIFAAVGRPTIKNRTDEPRNWRWTPKAFAASLRSVRRDDRHVVLRVDHDEDRPSLASTDDGSLQLWADRYGLRWRIDLDTVRGRAAHEWLKANPTFRSVSIGGVATRYSIRTIGAGKHATQLAACSRFWLEEISFVEHPGLGNKFTASANPSRTSTMSPQHETPVGRALRAIEAAERGQLQMVHVQPEAIQAAIAAGLLVAGRGRLKHRLTAKGRAMLTAGSSGSSPKIGARGGVTTLHF